MNDEFEEKMRQFELYHSIRVIPSTWIVIRVDGRAFHTLTEKNYEKPFDPKFHEVMIKTATTLLEEMQGIYAFTESDEISILFKKEWDLFDRELEKIVTISAGLASAAFTKEVGQVACFDSRVWVGVDESFVQSYFCWRQSDTLRCCLNGWAYWILRKQGKSPKEAASVLKNTLGNREFLTDFLSRNGKQFNDIPLWQRRGTGLYWVEIEKKGFNPVRKEEVTTVRKRIMVDEEIPIKEDYDKFLVEKMSGKMRRVVDGPTDGKRKILSRV